ncbi:hypothetical protein jhhlp_007951 [Lomentospora prolificans]|uniref:FAD-binding domain-containing protein n=1 Tax=Lomentospora prolificans TaxID=41688 RepID=A0A2N3MZT2_9PEZI|nr:hypothetical protein jhhlp_007956 [Lomentospora prolificans]PKS05707.1 hypothetical protein jhhlp_007951 [Lomentospora prolificans]
MAQSSNPHFLEGKRIIVVGAGMAGLAFATGMRKQWDPARKFPNITIYERDTKVTAVGREGFSLSLAGYDETGGLYALMQLGLLDEILPHVILGLDGQGSFKMWDEKFSPIISVRFKPAKGLPSAGIRIARKDLRKVLIDAGENDVVWNAACRSVRKLDTGKVAVKIQLGDADEEIEEECDLLVCADGANSRIRTFLRPDDRLVYAGAVQLGGSSRFTDGLPEPVGEDWGITVTGKGVACFFSPVDKTSLVWAFSRVEKERVTVTDKSSDDERRAIVEEVKKLSPMFAEPFPSILQATELDTVFAMPAKDKEAFAHDISNGPIVFIGDANHAVSPFAGYGASLALKDGWDLADQLCQAQSLESALKAYDGISMPRAKKSLANAHSRIKDFHSTGIRFFFFKLFSRIGGFFLWLTGQS